MCTGVRFADAAGNLYFGRNLDWCESYGEGVVITPRGASIPTQFLGSLSPEHACVGMGIVVGGVLAEIIMTAGKRSKAAVIAAFAVWTLCFWLGQESMVFLAGGSYVDMVVQSGMSREYGETLVGFMQSPLIVVAGALCVVGPIVGGLLGSKIFNKHFARIAA